MKISIIIPFYNEEANVAEVLSEVIAAQPDAEIIAIDDGSTDQTFERISCFAHVRHLRFPKNLGQSAAFYAGLHAATGDVCVMMDGDGQNNPSDIAQLLPLLAQYDLVCGYRARRKDSWTKRAASRIANNIRRYVLDDGIRDTGCSLKALHREHVKLLISFNGLHRFIPAICKGAGLKITEIPVDHRARKHGLSKYTVAGRAWRGLRDLIGVQWFLSRQIHWPLDPHHHD